MCVQSALQLQFSTSSAFFRNSNANRSEKLLNQRFSTRLLPGSLVLNGTRSPMNIVQVSLRDLTRNLYKRAKMNRFSNVPRGGQQKQHQQGKNLRDGKQKRNRMYFMCLIIVFIWISSGTLFYSRVNDWPLPQAFFYAVDAGMSIGFCTDVFEVKRSSKAFTVLFILLGASCVGGALALFIKDILEGVVDIRQEAYERLLAENIVQRMDTSGTGKLSHAEFRRLVEEWVGKKMSDECFSKLCRRFDPLNSGFIKTKHFVERCHTVESLLCADGPLYSENIAVRIVSQAWEFLQSYRVYFILLTWILTGMLWGVKRQGWDIITSAHFAVSALSTGGLTGPSVNSKGILPTEPAIFCGLYCLFGIPLFALTLGHFARLLVESYVSAVEEKIMSESISEPIDITEFEYAKNLCSTDAYIHLSDFVVLQLLRQGRVDIRMINMIKNQFNKLDKDGDGVLNFDEATKDWDVKEIGNLKVD